MKLFRNLADVPRDLWVCFAAALINRAGSMALVFLFIYLTRKLNISVARAGFIVGIYGVGAFLAAPLTGKLSDRLNRFKLMYRSLILSGLVLLIFPFVQSFFGMILLTFCWAVISEAFRPASLAVITEMVEEKYRKMAFALNRQAINLGLSIGPALGGFLIALSYQAVFFIDAITSILAGLLLFFTFRKKEINRAESNQAAATAAAAAGGFALNHRAISKASKIHLIYFLLAVLPALMIFFQNRAALALFVTGDLQLPESSYGLLFTVNTILIIVFEVPLNSSISKWAYRYSLGLGIVLVGAGFGTMIFVTNFAELVLSVIVWTTGEMFLLPGITAYIADISPAWRRGEFMGFYSMMINIAMATAPWIGTTVMENYGSKTLWAGAFLTGCFSVSFLWLVIAKFSVRSPSTVTIEPLAKQNCG